MILRFNNAPIRGKRRILKHDVRLRTNPLISQELETKNGKK
jgi:hypothetical protein